MKLTKTAAVTATATATAFAALAAGLSLTACGATAKAPAAPAAVTHSVGPIGGNQPNLIKPSPAGTPVVVKPAAVSAPTAVGTLTADGYRVLTDYTYAEIVAKVGAATAPYITSAAEGLTRNISKGEVVIILSPAGVLEIGGTAAVDAGLQAQDTSGGAVTVSAAPDGSDVIRKAITG